jgi:hypothetical protein
MGRYDAVTGNFSGGWGFTSKGTDFLDRERGKFGGLLDR